MIITRVLCFLVRKFLYETCHEELAWKVIDRYSKKISKRNIWYDTEAMKMYRYCAKVKSDMLEMWIGDHLRELIKSGGWEWRKP
jgi:hypothetical protein